MKGTAMKPYTTALVLVAAGLVGTISTTALAQTEPLTVGGVKWKPIEQGTADRGPLSISLRDTRVDLRTGMNFDREYALDGRPKLFGGSGESSDYYMRMNGG